MQASWSKATQPCKPVVFVSRYIDNPSGGLGRYERELVDELRQAKCAIEVREAKPLPIPNQATTLFKLAGRDIHSVLRRHSFIVPGNRSNAVFHLSNQELAAGLVCQRYRVPTIVT